MDESEGELRLLFGLMTNVHGTLPLFSDNNECLSNPCQFGVCVDGVNRYTCNCQVDFTGTNCDTGRDNVQSVSLHTWIVTVIVASVSSCFLPRNH